MNITLKSTTKYRNLDHFISVYRFISKFLVKEGRRERGKLLNHQDVNFRYQDYAYNIVLTTCKKLLFCAGMQLFFIAVAKVLALGVDCGRKLMPNGQKRAVKNSF